ncbi:hypothetical protein [Mycobacterium sp. 852014-52144_SCH5372336]|uniref:hypothetical protein n=1 Tax=Mycobacterium sp. 852014-52144_SCH5372336 TaxID=1834115 RepID=UPI0007FF8D8B|nr:hypothetical protein [Mycobacterium sp. 852014-52144_SCH5372336]OBB74293.1 hypothetical protein A5759_13825 [Mycobacterium sp. 852014-52144_SCH5372336]
MNARLAAGAGVVSVFLLVSGSGAVVAYAHPGDSRGSDRGHSADRGGGHLSRGSGNGKHDNDRRDGKRTTGSKRGGDTNGPGAAPKSRVGSGRDGLAQPSPDSRPGAVIAPESAGRTAPDSAGRAAAPDVSASRAAAAPDVSASRSAVADATPPVEAPVNTASAAPVASGGSGAASAPGPAFEPPQVTFGNGRVPQSRDLQPETGWQPPALAPSAPVPAQPIPTTPLSPAPPAPAVLDPVATPPAVVRQFVVAPGAGTSDPLWGLAGLLLIPVAGAALGYRQARAAQAAERIGRP